MSCLFASTVSANMLSSYPCTRFMIILIFLIGIVRFISKISTGSVNIQLYQNYDWNTLDALGKDQQLQQIQFYFSKELDPWRQQILITESRCSNDGPTVAYSKSTDCRLTSESPTTQWSSRLVSTFLERINQPSSFHLNCPPNTPARLCNPIEKIMLNVDQCIENFNRFKSLPNFICCVETLNALLPVLNENKFSSPVRCILTMMVDGIDFQLLQITLKSLSRVRDIDQALLIVSYAEHNPKVYEFMESINFVRILQVHHPFSLQFLSTDSLDRTLLNDESVYIDQTVLSDGLFVSDPDLSSASSKHHWWWLMNFIFQHKANLPVHLYPSEKNFPLAILKEGDMTSPDYLEAISSWNRVRLHTCPDCIALNMGYESVNSSEYQYNSQDWMKAKKARFKESGVILDVSGFYKLWRHRYLFCFGNQVSWYDTVQWMQEQRNVPTQSLRPVVPRVISIKSCHSTKTCNKYVNWTKHMALPKSFAAEYPMYSIKDENEKDVDERAFRRDGGWIAGRRCMKVGQCASDLRFWSTHLNAELCLRIAEQRIGWRHEP